MQGPPWRVNYEALFILQYRHALNNQLNIFPTKRKVLHPSSKLRKMNK